MARSKISNFLCEKECERNGLHCLRFSLFLIDDKSWLSKTSFCITGMQVVNLDSVLGLESLEYHNLKYKEKFNLNLRIKHSTLTIFGWLDWLHITYYPCESPVCKIVNGSQEGWKTWKYLRSIHLNCLAVLQSASISNMCNWPCSVITQPSPFLKVFIGIFIGI